MDFLNQAYAQLNDLLRSMTPAARITSGLLLAVVIISLVYLVRFQTGGGGEYLLGGRAFEASELTAMEAAFSQANLTGWTRDDHRIRVPRGQTPAFMGALVDNEAMPAHFGSYFNRLMDQESPWVSRQQREMNFQAAKEQELALILRNMKGVETATVQYDEVNQGGFPPRKAKTAFAALRAADGRSLEQDRIKSIRSFLVHAVAGLERRNVTVLDLNTGITHADVGLDQDSADADSLYVSQQAKAEQWYLKKIEGQLSMIPGVVVGVNVTLDPKVQQEKTQLINGPQTYALESLGIQKETTSSSPASVGRVGAVPNGVGNTPSSVASNTVAKSESTETETHDEQRNILDQTTIKSREAPFVPTRVTSSIRVPRSYFERIWRERNPPTEEEAPQAPDPAELRTIEVEVTSGIEDAVVGLLPPLPQGEDAYPQVKVTVYQDLTPPPVESPSVTDNAFTWLGANWQSMAMVLVGLVSLLMLRGMVRSAGSPPTRETPAAVDSGDYAGPESSEPEAAPMLRRKFGSTGPSLREELTEMVKEDPDAAANVLRSWIGDAA